MIINCKEIRQNEIDKLKSNKLENCKVVFIQVGSNQASNVYVRNKVKLCEELNINAIHKQFDEEITEEQLLNYIEELNIDNSVQGIMIQLPLPKHIQEDSVINAIDPKKDIDGFTNINKGKLMTGMEDAIVACTPAGIMDIFNALDLNLRGRSVVIVGRSNIVGKPMAQLLINAGATVTVCNSSTKPFKIAKLISESDIFISAIGQSEYFNKQFFENSEINISHLRNCIAIDVGINRNSENKLCGDIAKELYDNFAMITSVPGGVGIMTTLNVTKNIYKCYNLQKYFLLYK